MFSFTPACLFSWGLFYKSDLGYGRKPWIHNFQPAIYTPPKNTCRLASISSTIAAISSSKQFASLIRSVSDWTHLCWHCAGEWKNFYLILNMKFFHRSRVLFFFSPLCFQWALGLTTRANATGLHTVKPVTLFFFLFLLTEILVFSSCFWHFDTSWSIILSI